MWTLSHGDATYQEPVREDNAPNVVVSLLGWLLRTLSILIGFALLGWLLLHFAPAALTGPADVIDAEPVAAGLFGLAGAILLIFIPFLSALLVFLVWLLWGWFSGLIIFIFLFGILALLWSFSPIITGVWLGRRIIQQTDRSASLLIAMLVGVLLIVVLGRVPLLGWLVYLLSFIFALGGLMRAVQVGSRRDESSTTVVAG